MSDLDRQRAELADRVAQQASEVAALEQRRAALDAATTALAHREDGLANGQAALAEAQTALGEQETHWASRLAELQLEAAALAEARTAITQQRADCQILRDALEQERTTLLADRHEFEVQQQQLQQHADGLAAQAADQEARAEQLDRRQAECQRQSGELAARDAAQQQHAVELQQRHDLLERQRAELDAIRQQLRQREQQTRDQRRHIAQQLRAERAEQLASLEQRRAELVTLAADDQIQVAAQLAESAARYERLQEELHEHREKGQLAQETIEALQRHREELGEQLALARQDLADQQLQTQQLQTQWEQRLAASEESAASGPLQAELAAARQAVAAAQAESRQLAAQVTEAHAAAEDRDVATRQALQAARQKVEELQQVVAHREEQLAALRLADPARAAAQQAQHADELEQLRAAHAAQLEQLRAAHAREAQEWQERWDSHRAADRADDELQGRYADVLEELRDVRGEKERLAQQLAAVRADRVASSVSSPGFDWETQKQHLLAQLEEDGDGGEPMPARDRMTVEGAIRITDEVVAGKDQEIAELKELLQQQAENIGSIAVGASAIADVLDQDELIRVEREHLARLHEELQEKLRQAEIEAALERARLARERASLEEKLRQWEHERGQPRSDDTAAEADRPRADRSKSPGRWLARLGLKDE